MPQVDPYQPARAIGREGVHESKPLSIQEQRSLEADSATTLLERERTLRGISIEQAAKKVGVTEARFRAFESGTAAHVSGFEGTMLQQQFGHGLSVRDLLSAPTEALIAKANGRF